MVMSQPSWAAWIEICKFQRIDKDCRSQPSWAAWIEIIMLYRLKQPSSLSQPSWAAWIEISSLAMSSRCVVVAALLGCVD